MSVAHLLSLSLLPPLVKSSLTEFSADPPLLQEMLLLLPASTVPHAPGWNYFSTENSANT